MTTTQNLKLNKPNADDFYNINVQNENMNIIDQKVTENNETLGIHLEDKVGHITSVERTAWNNKLDATGTAVNADMVDGLHSTDLLRYIERSASPTDLNKTLATGIYRGTSFSNGPAECQDGQGTVIVINYSTSNMIDVDVVIGVDLQWVKQIFISPHTTKMWQRAIVATSIGEWVNLADNDKYFPITGGTLSGDLIIETGSTPKVMCRDTTINRTAQVRLDSYWGATTLVTESDAYNWSGLYVHPEKDGERSTLNSAIQLFRCVTGATSSYNIFGSHNKPAGAYTGDGSTTTRTVDTKGLSNVCVVWSGQGFVLATSKGGLYCSGTGNVFIPPTEYTFIDGVFTITSNNVGINNSDTKYYYQVL